MKFQRSGTAAQALGHPAFLGHAEHGPPRGMQFTAALVDQRGAASPRWRARLRRAALAPVEQVQARKPSPIAARTQHHPRLARASAPAQRHVLEVRPVGGGAAAAEIRVKRLRARAGVVVVDLVVVPGHQPRHGGVQALQIRIGLVLRVTVAVVGQRARLTANVAANAAGPPRPLVDVIAHKHHQVQILGLQVTVSRVIAELEVLAGAEPEPQPQRYLARSRRRPRAPDRTHRVARHEPIEVQARRLKARHLHVHAVRPRRSRNRGPALHDTPERLILGDLPVDGDRIGADPAAIERLRRQPRPQHHARGHRLTGGHTESERIPGEGRHAP